MIYLDISALAKIAIREPEWQVLTAWLDDHNDIPLTTSIVSRVELLRATRRRGTAALGRAHNLLAEFTLIPLDLVTTDVASALDPPVLRTLDALHLAAALSLGGDLTTFVSYDARQLEAARTAGLAVACPGLTTP